MAITKQQVVARIEVLEDGVLQVQRAVRVHDDDGSLLGERFHRETWPPTTDPATLPPRVRAIANVVWTQAVIDAWIAAHPPTPPGG
jgi:hypothetical protein